MSSCHNTPQEITALETSEDEQPSYAPGFNGFNGVEILLGEYKDNDINIWSRLADTAKLTQNPTNPSYPTLLLSPCGNITSFATDAKHYYHYHYIILQLY